jgi:aspartyl-tRNA(Asn)/glutamyl-tRNA(Gln) amidotransferase subunit B
MRTKEEANDYRYFPDPDLQPISISDEWLGEIKSAMPILPKEIVKQLTQNYGINKSEANIIAEDIDLYNYFNEAKPTVNNQKSLINWLIGAVRTYLNDQQISLSDFKVAPSQLATIINLVDGKKISQQSALQELIPVINQTIDVLAKAAELNLLITEDNDEILSYIEEVLTKFAPQVQAYKLGKKGVLGLFVGEVMKLAKGKADAKKINDLIIDKLK